MFRPSSFWLAVCSALVALLILSFSFSLSAVALAALSFLAGYLLIKSRPGQHARSASTQNAQDFQNSQGSDDASSKATEIFALGRLFEATLDEMREGLLVVDADMRVVASNQAAVRLFNRAPGKTEESAPHRTDPRSSRLQRFPGRPQGKRNIKRKGRNTGRRSSSL